MNKAITLLLKTLILVFLFTIFSNSLASTTGEKKTEADNKTRLLLSKSNQGDFAHAGDREAINLVLDKVQNLSPQILNQNSLEIGCGFGGTANYIHQNGLKKIWAIDIDQSAINYAKSTYQNINFQKADATKITDFFDKDFFSLIYMFEVASAITDKAILLQQAKAVSKQGSILVILDYTQKINTNHSNIPSTFNPPLKLKEIQLLCQVIGWEIVEISDITPNYVIWHQKLLNNIEEKYNSLIATGFTKEEIELVYNNFNTALTQMKENQLTGTIIIAKSI
jgi:ubiquinone/menaquinone biosynthesis C-methylase UbiE